jgi:hypothetical protein
MIMKKYIFVLAGIALVLLLVNCGSDKPMQNEGKQQACLSVSLLKTSLTERVVEVVLTVTSAGQVVYSDSTPVVNGEFSFGTFEVPVGELTFTVRALDASGRTLYLGVENGTIEQGKSTTVSLTLLPDVPMVKLSPFHKSDAVAFSQFVSKLELYNIDRFSYGVFRIGYDKGMVRFDSVSIPSTAWGTLSVRADVTSGFVTLTVSRQSGTDQVPYRVPTLLDLRFTPIASGATELLLSVDSIANNQGSIPERSTLVVDNQSISIASGAGTATLEGLVTSAVSGERLFGADVTITGPENHSTTSGTDGGYVFYDLPKGVYAMSATFNGYNSMSRTVTLVDSMATVNFVLNPIVLAGQYRIVLTWGAVPRDLDAHLWTQIDGLQFEVCFSDTGSQDSLPFIKLDHDSMGGYGPETITIYDLRDTCRYAVRNYSNDTNITVSQAHVDVYSSAGLIANYSIPTSGSGRWWYVLDINPNGTIVTHNVITEEYPGFPSGQARRRTVIEEAKKN